MKRWRELVLRTTLVLPLLLWLAQRWGNDYVTGLLPLYRVMLALVLPRCTVASMVVTEHNGEWIVATQLVTQTGWSVAGHMLPSGISMAISTLAGHALKHGVIVVAASLIWPHINFRERGIRLLLSVGALLLLEAVDIPMVLAGATQDFLLANLFPDNSPSTFLIGWMHWLDGGGRLALPLLVVGSIAVCRNHAAQRQRQQ